MNGYAYTILVEAEKSIRAVVNCNERGCRDCWAELQAALQSISQAKQTLNRAEVEMTKIVMEERMRGPKDPAMTEDHLHVVDSMMENTFKEDENPYTKSTTFGAAFKDPDNEALSKVEEMRIGHSEVFDDRAEERFAEAIPDPAADEENLMEQAEYDRERLRLDGMENPDDPENG